MAAVPPSRSMSVTALPPVPVDEKTTAMRNDYDSNEDASSVNITAGRRKVVLYNTVVKSKGGVPQIANPQIFCS